MSAISTVYVVHVRTDQPINDGAYYSRLFNEPISNGSPTQVSGYLTLESRDTTSYTWALYMLAYYATISNQNPSRFPNQPHPRPGLFESKSFTIQTNSATSFAQ